MYNIIRVHNCTHVFMHINTPYMVILVELPASLLLQYSKDTKMCWYDNT